MSDTTSVQAAETVTNADALGALLDSQDLLHEIKEFADRLDSLGIERQHVTLLHTLAEAAIAKNAFGNEAFSELMHDTGRTDAPVSEALAKHYG